MATVDCVKRYFQEALSEGCSEIFSKRLIFLFLSISFLTYSDDLDESKWIPQESFHILNQALSGEATAYLYLLDTIFFSILLSQVCFPSEIRVGKRLVSVA